MAREEFIIRVTKKGEILVEIEGLPPRRVKDLVTYFEETLGPSRLVEGDGPEGEGGVLDESILRDYEHEDEQDQERQRLRKRF